jgi:BirA family biotin operon repressor/biotin-[acetyl-CoA-carboxylase] ligase
MRDKILHLLKDDEFVSGANIAENLGISRTAVWKQIKSLQRLGYKIESVKNKGYKLLYRPDVPIPEEILGDLNTRIIGRNIAYFKTLSSTNLYARKLVDDGVDEGTIVVADVQHHGRGRKGRLWFSLAEGLWFSIILSPNIPPQQSMILTMVASISVAQAIREVTGLDPVIKWPNDVLINGKKVCGVLTEIDAEMDRIKYSIVGIGVNVNNKLSEGLYGKATTLMQELGFSVSKVELLRCILKHFDENYMILSKGNHGFIRDNWVSMSNIVGKKVLVKEDKNTIQGFVSEVDIDGCLILQTDSGIQRVYTGDIEYLE